MTQPPAKTTKHARLAVVVCAALLLVHVALAFLSAESKSPTYDEPLHSVSAWMHLHRHDYAVDPEDPPLWKYWAALPHSSRALHPDTQSDLYRSIFNDMTKEWEFTQKTLYRSSDQLDSDAFIMRSRAMMIVLSAMLGAVIGWWSYRLGGLWAAVSATFVYAFDPNFLAHGAIVKNDVPLALVGVALAIAAWRAGIRATVWNVLAVGVLCGVALSVKFSGLVFGPAVAILVIARAMLPHPWKVLRYELATRAQRFAGACAMLTLALIVSYVVIWGSYGFRFLPTSDPRLSFNVRQMLHYTTVNELIARNKGSYPTDEQIAAHQHGAFTNSIVWMGRHHLLPQAWLLGLLYTYQSALARLSFLLGRYSLLGWWYYFPLAMVVKTPLTTLATAAGAVAMFAIARVKKSSVTLPHGTWTALCLAVLPGFFLFMAMRSNLNLGLRHVLPVYPFIIVAIGVAAAWARNLWARPAKLVLAVAAITLAVETFWVFPNYMAFFNAAAGGSRGGLALLSDSNLDWGQDLKLVAQWQQEHPNVTLYFTYFGFADPYAYGVKYRNFMEGYKYGPIPDIDLSPGVLAISATHLQSVYYTASEEREFFARMRNVKPLEVLGGTIYLYAWPPPVQIPSRFVQKAPAVEKASPPTTRP